jgi:NDP-sugar pyrophosphorylase family protein
VARRLAPLTDATHKCLLPVGARPLLARMLDALAAAGISETILVVGHCADQIRALAGTRAGTMAIRYVENPDLVAGAKRLDVESVQAACDLVTEQRGHGLDPTPFRAMAARPPGVIHGYAKLSLLTIPR